MGRVDGRVAHKSVVCPGLIVRDDQHNIGWLIRSLKAAARECTMQDQNARDYEKECLADLGFAGTCSRTACGLLIKWRIGDVLPKTEHQNS